jgi:hypothetical protein
MLEMPDLRDDLLLATVSEAYGLRVRSPAFLPIGAGVASILSPAAGEADPRQSLGYLQGNFQPDGAAEIALRSEQSYENLSQHSE